MLLVSAVRRRFRASPRGWHRRAKPCHLDLPERFETSDGWRCQSTLHWQCESIRLPMSLRTGGLALRLTVALYGSPTPLRDEVMIGLFLSLVGHNAVVLLTLAPLPSPWVEGGWIGLRRSWPLRACSPQRPPRVPCPSACCFTFVCLLKVLQLIICRGHGPCQAVDGRALERGFRTRHAPRSRVMLVSSGHDTPRWVPTGR